MSDNRCIQFKLSDHEADEFDAAIEVLQATSPKITTPRKLFLRAVRRILDDAGISIEEDAVYVRDNWVPPDQPVRSAEEQATYDAKLAALLD